MIVDAALKLVTEVLKIVKKMSFKDFIMVALVLSTISFAWANDSNKNDAIDAKADFEAYKTDIEAKKYEDKIKSLSIDKEALNIELDKINKKRVVHQRNAGAWKTKFDELQKQKPNKTEIKNTIDNLNGVADVCKELTKYDITCFIYSSNQ